MTTAINTPLDEIGAALIGALYVLQMYDDPYASTGTLIRTEGLDDLAAVHVFHGRVLVAFAGTRNVRQWVSNFDNAAIPRRLPSGVRVHPGAAESLASMILPLEEALQPYHLDHGKSIPIDVVGHSRGVLLALEFVRVLGSRLPIRDVITLGGPRVGDAQHASDVAANVGGRMLRWTNNNDPVVCMPGSWRGYRHVGELRHIDSRGRVHNAALGSLSGFWDGIRGRVAAVGRLRALDGVDDHRLQTGYVPALRKAYAECAA
jgi:hypothetical protein